MLIIIIQEIMVNLEWRAANFRLSFFFVLFLQTKDGRQ